MLTQTLKSFTSCCNFRGLAIIARAVEKAGHLQLKNYSPFFYDAIHQELRKSCGIDLGIPESQYWDESNDEACISWWVSMMKSVAKCCADSDGAIISGITQAVVDISAHRNVPPARVAEDIMASVDLRNLRHTRAISVKPSCFHPEFQMLLLIPENRDDEEYIDEFLDSILNKDIRYNIEWDFDLL